MMAYIRDRQELITRAMWAMHRACLRRGDDANYLRAWTSFRDVWDDLEEITRPPEQEPMEPWMGVLWEKLDDSITDLTDMIEDTQGEERWWPWETMAATVREVQATVEEIFARSPELPEWPHAMWLDRHSRFKVGAARSTPALPERS